MNRPATFLVAIPARLASQRFPGKVLKPINGKPMLHHVIDRAGEAGAGQVVVATDSTEVAESLAHLPCEVCMTSTKHRSGTERLAETAARLQWPDEEIVVNLQGDEPLLPGQWLKLAAEDLNTHESAAIATLCHRMVSREEVFNQNVVKLVRDRKDYALYFSRAPIPWDREAFAVGEHELRGANWYRHVGVYAYRVKTLRRLAGLEPTALEQTESLEQLRALEVGLRIYTREVTGNVPISVDTEADLNRVETILRQTTNP